MAVVATLLPLAAWGGFFALFRARGTGWRVSFLGASLVWGAALALITELLSLFGGLTRLGVAAAWGALALASLFLARRLAPLFRMPSLPVLTSGSRACALALGILLGATLLVGVLSPPNNVDSLVYHMSRVMHWIQQGSVAHYPTNVLRQLEMNPWAEFAILHLQLLSGGDRLANLVQWFSFAGCLVGVSLIAWLFQASPRGQLFSALVAATVPMAILQASSTQNDLALSFWLVCLAFFGILALRTGRPGWFFLMSLSLGLAILTKGTAYVFALPFVVCFFALDLSRSWRGALLKYLALALVVFSLNLGHYQRNYALFGNPLHSGSDPYANSFLTPGVVLSNLSRNAALHLLTPSRELNRHLVDLLAAEHRFLGVELDDPGTTWPGTSIRERFLAPQEDSSGNPLHLIFYGGILLLMVLRPFPKGSTLYSALVLAGFLLFCTVLRWQPWHSRLQLPLFLLFAPVAGTVASTLGSGGARRVLAWLLCLAALPWVFCNATRPLVSLSPFIPEYPPSILTTPRQSQYFGRFSCDRDSYLAAASAIAAIKPRTIGLKTGGNAREYPLWVLTRTEGLSGPRIEHVEVLNPSRRLQREEIRPDLVVELSAREAFVLK